MAPWLRFQASNAGGMGSIPGLGTKIPHAKKILKNLKKIKFTNDTRAGCHDFKKLNDAEVYGV